MVAIIAAAIIILSYSKVYAYPQDAASITGTVIRVVDGDTIDAKLANGETVRIRLTFANTPERGEPGWKNATDFTKTNCPPGSMIIMDPDAGQPKSFNRNVAKVFCTVMQNQELLESGHATANTARYCPISEFATERWTGCS